MAHSKEGRWLDRVFRPSFDKKGLHILVLAVVVGVLAGYGAVLFRHIIRFIQYLFYGSSEGILTFVDTLPWYTIVLMPGLGGLIVGALVHYGAREAKGHGVPEVMEAVALRGGVIRKRVAVVKILASALSIGSGASVGREGPIVQIGASVGSTVGQLIRVGHVHQKTLVGCGAAAGIAATFNAPIAGVLFAMEVLLGNFGLASFSPIVLASVTATVISRYYFGDFPAFIVPSYEVITSWEYLLYPVLGVVCGLVAILFVIVLYKLEDGFDAIKIPYYIKAAIGGLILGVIMLKFPHVFGVGYGTIDMALLNTMPAMLMLALIGLKILATSITIGSGGSGGVFAPSLFIGAMIGGFFGWCAGQFFPGMVASPGAYALVAMGAVVAGTTHAPLTAILILFELTGDYAIILPVMTACIISTLTASTLKKGNIYTLKLLRRGVDISGGLEQNILKTIKVKDLMRPEMDTIAEGAPLSAIIEAFKFRDASYLHVVDGEKRLCGIISFRDIRSLLDEEHLNQLVIARDVATTDVITVTTSESIQKALQLMSAKDISQLPVVSEEDGKQLVGALLQKDVLTAYERAVHRKEMETS